MPAAGMQTASTAHRGPDTADGGAGTPTPFACPACSGVLSAVDDGPLLRLRCHVGHRFSPQSVAADQAAAVERMLWSASAALHERGLQQRLAQEARSRRDPPAVRRFEAQVRAAEAQKEHLRHMLMTVTEAADATEDDASAR